MASENINNVSVERLTKRMGKYSLVIAVSERAKEIKRMEERTGNITPGNQIGRSLAEITEAKIKIIEDNEDIEEIIEIDEEQTVL